MDRRSFLGSVIGLIVATKADFRAVEAMQKRGSLWSEAEITEFFRNATMNQLRQLVGQYRTTDGVIKSVRMTPLLTQGSNGSREITFIHEPWEGRSSPGVNVQSLRLATRNGDLLSDMRLYGGSQMIMLGDTLKATHTIGVPLNQ